MQRKYTDVLIRYKQELNKNREIFEEGKDALVLSLNRPKVAGTISWARSIFSRIQHPMLKFLTKPDLDQDEFRKIKNEYKEVAKAIDEYQSQKYVEWSENILIKAMEFLKKKILTRNGSCKYTVNFSDEFRVLIKEVKYLEKMGCKPSKTIINIALQEAEYFRYVDQLQNMLAEYHEAIFSLSEIDIQLLAHEIRKLDDALRPGHESLNLNSLGITDFIDKCRKAINDFRDIKKKVATNAMHIQKIIDSIGNAVLMKEFEWERKDSLLLMEFIEYFEKHRQEVLVDLAENYRNIGERYLIAIEESVFTTNTGHREEMKEYYYYWERKVYNALVKMIVRALLTYKWLLKKPPTPTSALFKIRAEFHPPNITTSPLTTEVIKILPIVRNNFLEASKQFPRWMDSHCKVYKPNEGARQTGDEEVYIHTFFPEISKNPVIKSMLLDLGRIEANATDKSRLYGRRWEEEYSKTAKNATNKHSMDRITEKTVSLLIREQKMRDCRNMIQEYEEQPTERIAMFIAVDYTSVINNFVARTKENLQSWASAIRKDGELELKNILEKIKEYHEALKSDPKDAEQLKILLSEIAEINSYSMEMELQISEMVEKFRILRMYNDKGLLNEVMPPESTMQDAFSLSDRWKALITKSKVVNLKLEKTKEYFSQQTKDEVVEFKAGLKSIYDKYIESGPGSKETTLDKGCELLDYYKKLVEDKSKKKDELVQKEKLFDIPISNFPELVYISEENKKLDDLYDEYKKLRQKKGDWAAMLWVKLDIVQLTTGADAFDRVRKKLGHTYAQHPIYDKLAKTITEFKESVPLIEKLKHPAITDRHWERLMKETGKNPKDFSIKNMTLEQVFELNLQDYGDKVDEIVVAAQNEAKNDAILTKIEQYWKRENFDMMIYMKGNEDKGPILKSCEQIKMDLEEQLTDIQQVASSPYVSAFQGRVKHWEKSLNIIAETIDIWLMVQRKWMYLEGIFTGSEDIRQQLADEAKNFDKRDKAFRKIMELTYKNPNIYTQCVQVEVRLTELKTLSLELDKCQKNLRDYLDSKRNIFPRFYFISDDELLSILGSADPTTIQQHLLKLFDNVKELTLGRSKQIMGMVSEEGESFEFREVKKPEGPIEVWMGAVDKEMQNTLKKIMKEGVFYYHKEERTAWVKKQLGMIALAGTQIWWTWRVEDVFRKVKEGNKHAMKEESAKQTKDLNDLIVMVRGNLDSLTRKKINTLIILDVHARDIVDRFVRDSILLAREFEWESQLRFYWNKDVNDIVINQCTGSFSYCYEYQGLNGRLVITPLTDRCVMTLTTALTFKLGGSPAGPAGTGKTETVKDLAKALALRCVVTNCGDNMDYEVMGTIFTGLVQTGFWGCFDEFNRINPEVLSVVSTQLTIIQTGLTYSKKTIDLLGREVNLIPTVGIFVTMNPGYEGRSELPDNLKALFRPVVMVVPDLQLICEIMLMSEGFSMARILAKKMTVLYKLAREQLSKQYHYDFGLRALKSVLVLAGSLKRDAGDLGEDSVLYRALRDMNTPKFVYDDVPLFKGLLTDLFPGLTVERIGHEKLKERVRVTLREAGCQELDEQVDKVIQLFETILTRHSTMVVGPTGAGKSMIIETLRKAQENTVIHPINPKAQSINELYGVLNVQTREWTDGLLSKIFRNCSEKPLKEEIRWILFDGDVDAVWVENMNSVMDDSKLLTLNNGERIRLEKYCKLLFEVFDLQYASPATISRCGMVYVDPKILGYEPYYQRWVKKWFTKKDSEGCQEFFADLFNKYLPPCINFIYDGVINEDEIGKPLEFVIPRTNVNVVAQMLQIMDAILPEEEAPQEYDQLEHLFIFSIMWSMGTCLTPESKKKFDEFMRRVSSRHLPATPLLDNCYDYSTRTWVAWEKKVRDYQPTSDGKFSKILVPTVDTERFSYMFLLIGSRRKAPVMLCGESGTAKSVIIQNFLNTINQEEDVKARKIEYAKLNINFSSRTNAMDVYKILDDNLDKKSGRIYGPKQIGKTLMVFIDDLHMPRVDKYGTQQPIAFLKFLIEKKYMYERGGNLDPRYVKDTQFLAALLPPGGGINKVDPRFISLFSVFNISFPPQETIEKIYSTILRGSLQGFPEEVQQLCSKLTQATLKLYNQIVEMLPRTPLKFHYIFNLRDLSRIYEGLCRAKIDKFPRKEGFIRLWRNECLRVFSDRLIVDVDRKLVGEQLIPALLKEFFPDSQERAMEDPILFGDYLKAAPADPEVENPHLYEDLGDFANVEKKFKQILVDYNDDETHKEMQLVLFNDALDHLTKIMRIISVPRGHALLVGYGGSGKQSLTQLAAYTAGYKVFSITLKRNYKEVDFRDELKKLYEQLTQKPTVFLFTDAHVVEEGFLELINNMLTVGMVPALFDEAGRGDLAQKVADEAKKLGIVQKDELWDYTLEKIRDNLHIVLAMSPAGENLRVRCRNFPGLISNTTIDWFFPWPSDALFAVANFYLEEVELPEENREAITQHIVTVHSSVYDYSRDFEIQLKRKNFSTPKNYLDFLTSYRNMLATNRKMYGNMITRYENGLLKLEAAAKDVEEMQVQLTISQKELAEKMTEVNAIIEDISNKTEKALKAQEAASEQEKQLQIDRKEAETQQKEADQMLKEAEPILKEAEKAVENIKPNDLVFLKNLPNPPKPVKAVCEMLLIFKPNGRENENGGWSEAKMMLGEFKLLGNLKGYAPRVSEISERAITKVMKMMNDPENELSRIGDVSAAAEGLLTWITSTKSYWEVYRKVRPLEENVKRIRAKLKQLQEDLEQTQEFLRKTEKELAELNDEKDRKQKVANELEEQTNLMTKRLNAAMKLISGLGREQVRWTEDKARLAEKKTELIGECLACSSFLCYAGPFDYTFRKKMVFEHWVEDIRSKGIPMVPNFRLENLLTNDVEMAGWNAEGLPGDELSIQNGILTLRASRWPLCVDPQQQAVRWIKEREKKLIVRTFADSNFQKELERAITNGIPMLFENVDEELDPYIDPILYRNFVTKASMQYVKLGDTELQLEKGFRLYMTSKLSNPNYTPEIMSKTMVINFNVTLQGLRDQLLGHVVQFERPEKEEQRKELIMKMSDNRKTLKALEDKLLKDLAESVGSLVDNEALIQTLEDTKLRSEEISAAIIAGEETAKEIEETRRGYITAALRGAILFFAMSSLSKISVMYEYSLEAYLKIFKKSLGDAKADKILENRLRNIIDKLTLNVYDYTCLGIFEVHKLMFSFQMTTMIMDGDEKLNRDELGFFLKGNTSLSPKMEAKPFDWIPDVGWLDINGLVEVGPEYKDIINHIRANGDEWKKWYDQERPEDHELPGDYKNLTKFQMLLVIRCLRPDRVYNGVKRFIIQHFNNEHYVNPPTIVYERIFDQSTNTSPIVFILSPGADPLSDVQKLGDSKGFVGNKFKYLSLGQGMESQATDFVRTSSQRGHWVMLQNCHLLPKWLKSLEKMLQEMNAGEQAMAKVNPDFRLWLTTQPTEEFPLGILQLSLKIVTEPPDGIRNNMMSVLSKLSDETLNSCKHYAFKPLIYVITFFHAVVQDRRKYGKIGWNVTYDFNESDFRISQRLLGMYLQKALDNKDEVIPWGSLKYLIGEAMYGGRVTDDYDRRTLVTYLDEYMGDFLFDKGREFYFAKTIDFNYSVPKNIDMESVQTYLKNEFPQFTYPEVFGLHPNAEITYFTNSAKNMWENLLKMQTGSGGGASSEDREKIVGKVADDILEDFPKAWDVVALRKQYDVLQPTQVVLFQELEIFNMLIEKIRDTLTNLKRALKGEIGMSAELDDLLVSLLNGFLPTAWRKLAPQTQKKLPAWLEHFKRRVRQYTSWVQTGEPAVMWLSGLHIPESYLTALVQTTCRAKGWALDKSTLYTVIRKNRDPSDFKKKPEHGCYVTGLYLEGASWDVEKGHLIRQAPKELLCEMPIIEIVPVEANKLKLKGKIFLNCNKCTYS